MQLPQLTEVRGLRHQVKEGQDLLGLCDHLVAMTVGWIGVPVNLDVAH